VLQGTYALTVPQSRPLSPGELLGCTAPRLAPGAHDALLYVADGRFHLEAAMVANPELPAYRYDPYAKALTRERYRIEEMHGLRQAAIAVGACYVCLHSSPPTRTEDDVRAHTRTHYHHPHAQTVRIGHIGRRRGGARPVHDGGLMVRTEWQKKRRSAHAPCL
jgi:hypothetical protein